VKNNTSTSCIGVPRRGCRFDLGLDPRQQADDSLDEARVDVGREHELELALEPQHEDTDA
jgi:hypothetical protein